MNWFLTASVDFHVLDKGGSNSFFYADTDNNTVLYQLIQDITGTDSNGYGLCIIDKCSSPCKVGTSLVLFHYLVSVSDIVCT